MPTPHKGPRTRVVSRIPDPVYAELQKRQLAAGVDNESQFIADVLAQWVGRPDLVRELNQEVFPLTA